MSQSKFKAANLLAGTAVVALGLAVAGQASADGHARVIKSSKDQVSLKISGQISREMTYLDDGVNERIRHADSNYSSSRFRFHADAKVNADLKVSGLAEIALDDARNTVSNVAGSTNNSRSGNDLQTRIAEIQFKHSQFGKLSLGAGNAAANGVANTSLHGIYSALPGGMFLQTTTTEFTNSATNTQSGADIGKTLAELDFNSRTTRIRYDTPVLAGFQASVSHSDSQQLEYALRYSGKAFDTRIKASVGMAQNTSTFTNSANISASEMYGAYIAAIHSSGLGATFGCGYFNSNTSENEKDPAGCHVQGHFQRKFNELGKTSLVLEYEQKDDVAARGDIAKGYGVTLHQAIDNAALEIWAKYASFELDRDGTDFNDMDAFTVGTRIKF